MANVPFFFLVIRISRPINNKGKNAVLISEDEWKNIEETLYLSSIPGLVDDVNNIKNNEDWKKAKEYNPDEEW